MAVEAYDRAEMETKINKIHSKTVEKITNSMAKSLVSLIQKTDETWVGASGEMFKNNMQTDYETVCQSLRDIYDIFRKETYQIINETEDNADERGA